ncbi:hypothetical protein [Streptomyces sp. NPDC054783]
MLDQVTGIVSRRAVAGLEYASTLAVRAARPAPVRSGPAPYDMDLLVFASATRDMAEPATARVVQAEPGSRAHASSWTSPRPVARVDGASHPHVPHAGLPAR